ncbi:MAG: hypothetical protein ACRDWW_03690 [Acidimicrobiales bacterium]
MFAQDFLVIDRPYDQVLSCLNADALFEAAFEGARAEGASLRARVGPAGWPAVFSKTMEIRSGPLRYYGDSALIPFSWVAPEGESLFPRLDADLEVAPFGSGQTQLVLRARYAPPGGALGRGLDRVLLHRLAESTLRAFLTGICTTLDGQAAGSPR